MDRNIGKVLDDRYEIEDSIGIGGMAYVYKARCRRLSRFVAIKILKQEFANDIEFKRRFKNESNAVARLSHKNIVNIFDVSNSDKIDYIVMELIEGVTLKEYLQKKGKLPWMQALLFSGQIAEALEHAHSRGIIHQDIKPHNIMLLRDGTLKVADFGIAKLENEGETKVIKEAIGSVHYVSPEQAKGNTIDTRTDIYSLGVVMYEMVTGRTPYKGDTAISIVMQHINSVPAPPSSHNEEMPKAFEYIILKAMSSSLNTRYKTASELMIDLDKVRKNPDVVLENDILSVLNTTQKISSDEVRKALAKSPREQAEELYPEIYENLKEETEQTEDLEEYDEDDEDEYYAPRKNGAIIFMAMLVILGITWYAGTFMFDQVFKDEIEPVLAPAVVDLKYDDVIETYADLNFIVNEEIYSAEPVGTIISQKPTADSELALDSVVYLTLSLGERTNAMPNLTEYDYIQAQIELQSLGITDIEVEYDYHDEIAEGKVYETTPEYGEAITASTSVKLMISAGKEIVFTSVPSLKGLTVEQATLNLEIAGLEIGEVIMEISETTAGLIIAQGIQSGTSIEEGTLINVVVAEKSPEPVIATKSITVYIPQEGAFNSYYMQVYVDNKIAYEAEHHKDQVSFSVDVTGTGSSVVTIYAGGLLIDERIVMFN
ncbi:MAG: Stk1 family PASTA domain-containing Ser/Thr kinase [Clostridia bacterium]